MGPHLVPQVACAESHAGADRGCPRAPVHGGQFVVRTTGTRAESHAGADRGCSPLPQLMEAIVEVAPSVPQERVQNRTLEQIVDFPVPHLMEAIVEVVPSPPQECVQNRTLEQVRVHSRIQEQIMDLPVPSFMAASTAFSGKVFTVDMRHLRGDQACPVDTLGFNFKGLDKYTMPRSGDVMVPALHMDVPVPQISEDIVLRERIIERFGHSISWDSLEAALSPTLFRALRQRALLRRRKRRRRLWRRGSWLRADLRRFRGRD